jgi:EAL domain-containing protein (putative c-di-GMP-specific phosphodiesterase class I)/GGDEF domain-containing protein
MSGIAEILAREQVYSVFQPIVDLDSDAVVAYEALVRGPVGDLQRPDALFAAAAAAGRLQDLDELCQFTALRGAISTGIFAPLTLFINVEPEVVEPARLDRLLAIAEQSPGRLQLMLEITERALAVRPADLLATVQRLRTAGWRIALDDVGSDDLSLAFMPLLQPDVIKLDMALVQHRPGRKFAEFMNAINSYAERTGCLILAEGIENAVHLAQAHALGATLGQGWWFGRPAEGPVSGRPTRALQLPPPQPGPVKGSPFQCLPESVTLRRTTKALLIQVSKHLERAAQRLGGTCVVISTFQHARNFTPLTAHRYRDLAANIGFTAAIGAGLEAEPAHGVRGADLAPGDPVRQEWDIIVLAPHFAAALIARDLDPTSAAESDGDDDQRPFEFALTYDRTIVEAAARSLITRVLPSPVPRSDSPSTTMTTGQLRSAANHQTVLCGGPAEHSKPNRDDPADDLLDRQQLLHLAEAPLLEAQLNDTGIGILHLDLDRDRDHVHTPDHPLSQAAPKTAADQLQSRIRRRDLIARHRNNIIIVLTDLDPSNAADEAAQIAASLTANLTTLHTHEGPDPLTIRVGISTFPADGPDPGQLPGPGPTPFPTP